MFERLTNTTVSGQFQTTQWGLVMAASREHSDAAKQALEQLCRIYWYPIYAFVRRQGQTVENAQDLTQEFFLRVLQENYFQVADPERGRLRSFLLTSLKNFLINEWEKARTAKRGGSHITFSLDEKNAEGRYLAEPTDGLTPDLIYEKRWAVTLLEQALARLRSEYVAEQKQLLFDTLKPSVLGDTESGGYGAMAERLGLSEGALRIAMHRLRERYRTLLRAEVASTVATPSEIDDELRHLVAVLRS